MMGWSAVTSATANATLAAVLAGFMINGIILLLGNREMASKAGYVQALSLLFTAFVALGLDAYLFGLVTGDSTAVIGKLTACRRAWTEAMLAAGLLGVGTVAIIAGFVFLFAVYFRDQSQDKLGPSLDLLIMLCTMVRSGVALVVVTLIYVTSRSYLLATFTTNIPIWGKIFIRGYLAIGILTVAAFVVAVVAAERRKLDQPLNRFVQWLRAEGEERFVGSLKIAIFYSLVYSVATVIIAAFVTSSDDSFWDPSRLDVKAVALGVLIWISLVPLVPLLLLTGRIVPEFKSAAGAEVGVGPPGPASAVPPAGVAGPAQNAPAPAAEE
jgi:hypothetical protein